MFRLEVPWHRILVLVFGLFGSKIVHGDSILACFFGFTTMPKYLRTLTSHGEIKREWPRSEIEKREGLGGVGRIESSVGEVLEKRPKKSGIIKRLGVSKNLEVRLIK